jgi:hypothetical protein
MLDAVDPAEILAGHRPGKRNRHGDRNDPTE